MKANRFAAINDDPILAQVPYGDWGGQSTGDMRNALNFYPDTCEPDAFLPPVQVASYMHSDLAEFLSRHSGS